MPPSWIGTFGVAISAGLALLMIVSGVGSAEQLDENQSVPGPSHQISTPNATEATGPSYLPFGSQGCAGVSSLPDRCVADSGAERDSQFGAPVGLLQLTPASWSSLYYEGSDWNTSTDEAFSMVSVVITTPSSVPINNQDGYFVILSIWDNSSTYDQVGLGAFEGGWYVAYSDEPFCDGTYDHHNTAHPLSPNTVYEFAMTIESGSVVFSASEDSYGTLTQIWSVGFHDGATSFSGGDEGWFVCQQGSNRGQQYWDYTDYEEIHNTFEQNWPDFDFDFTQNAQLDSACQVSGCPGDWDGLPGTLGSTPPGLPTQVVISGNSTFVENEWFNASVNRPPGLYSLGIDLTKGAGGNAYVAGVVSQVCQSCSHHVIDLSTFAAPQGWTSGLNVTSGQVTLHWSEEMGIPANTPNGTYTVTVQAEDSTTGNFTFVQFSIAILELSGGGGGGCVARGTPILTPSGYLPVQRLRVGAIVVGYNLTTGQTENLTVLGDNSTRANSILVINDGLLELTITDQPVWVRNLTFEGWLLNPEQLKEGDYLFLPVTSSWLQITSLSIEHRSVEVFDVVTSGPNNFIANGVLLDRKP